MSVELLTSWIIEGNSSFQDKVRIYSDISSQNGIDLIDETTCFSLLKPEGQKTNDCDIKIIFGSQRGTDCVKGVSDNIKELVEKGAQIDHIVVFSEAKFIEVYAGIHNEYLQTVQSELISHFEDASIYKTNVPFTFPQKFVKLLLKGLYSSNNTWIYGISLNIGLPKDENITISHTPSENKLMEQSMFMMEAMKCVSAFKGLKVTQSDVSKDKKLDAQYSAEEKIKRNSLNEILLKMDKMEKNLMAQIDSKFQEFHQKTEKRLSNIEQELGKLARK